MGRMVGKGSSGPGEKETWRTEVVLIRVWIVSSSYVPGMGVMLGGLFWWEGV